jgi:hypothetical protein
VIDRRALLLTGGAAAIAGPAFAQDGLSLNGAWRQGGFALGKTWPRALIFVDGEALTAASASGLFIVGFDRDAPASTLIEARLGARTARRQVAIAPHQFPRAVINGLPPSTVEPTDPALLALIQEQSALKQHAFASRIDTEDFKDGFAWPLDAYRISSAWGSQRVLNGTPARPHYGLDMAAPQGTVIKARWHAFRGRPDADRSRPGSDQLLPAPVGPDGQRRRPRFSRPGHRPHRHDGPCDGPTPLLADEMARPEPGPVAPDRRSRSRQRLKAAIT